MSVRRGHHRLTGDTGSAIVEFALVVPLFLALIVGLATSAMAFLTQHQLSTAAQEGARVMYLAGTSAQAVSAVNAAAGTPAPTVTVSAASCTPGTTVTVTAARPAAIRFVFFPSINVTITGRGVVRCP